MPECGLEQGSQMHLGTIHNVLSHILKVRLDEAPGAQIHRDHRHRLLQVV